MPLTASQLRQDVYQLLDRVLETGEPLEIVRKGRTLRLVADPVQPRLDLIRPDLGLIVGDPEELVDVGWAEEWEAEKALPR